MSRAVIDQPGFRVVLVGLALSLFLGLAIQAQISETRVQKYLSKSVDRLQKDFIVDFESAQISLSRWGFPLPYLHIHKIRLSPKNNLCQSSQIYIDTLEVPFSLSIIFGDNKSIPKVRVQDMELRLSNLSDCLQEKPAATAGTAASPVTAAAEPKAEPHLPNLFANKTKAELRDIYIERLKIISGDRPEQPILLKQLNFELSYENEHLSQIDLKSKISALKDTRSDIYFLNAGVTGQFKTRNGNEIESVLNLNGKLLDGDVLLAVHGGSASKKVSYELTFDRVSVRSLLPFVENNEMLHSLNPEKIPFFLSFVNNGEIILGGSTPEVNSKLTKLLVNIDNGFLRSQEIEIGLHNGKPVLKPFTIELEALALTKLKNLEQFRKKLDSFESLGVLNGRFEFRGENQLNVKGTIKNVEAVFSNRGRRDLQKIDEIRFAAARQAGQVTFQASDFALNGTRVAGKFEAQHDLDHHTTTAQFKLSQVTLSEKIWEQFTFVEQSPKVDMSWTYQKAGDETHNFKLHVDEIAMPGVKLQNLQVDLHQAVVSTAAAGRLQVNIKPGRFTSDSSFLENKVVKQFLNPASGFKETGINTDKLNLQITGTDWKNVEFNLESQFPYEAGVKVPMRLNFHGSVKYGEGLNAKLSLQGKNNTAKFILFTNPQDEIEVKAQP